MKRLAVVMIVLILFISCQKQDDSEELFTRAEGFVKLNMYKEALDIYIELKSRDYKSEIVQERIKYVSSKLAEEKLRTEVKPAVVQKEAPIVKGTGTSGPSGGEFRVSRCDESYNERINNIKNEMKPYQEELGEIEKKMNKISSEYKVVNNNGVYSIAVPADTPREKQKEIADGPAKEFGTLNSRKNEIMQKLDQFNTDINKVVEEAKKAGQPSDCIKR